MENLKDVYKDLPQLIVALDSLNDDANYVHIKDVKEGVTYYCPCCKGIIKPRAYKDDKKYQYQAHFYHDKGGCTEETFVHFICKTWLFESGCKFKVRNNIYTVEKIETEKTYHTEFGDYRPDITVYTTEGKTFFFEIRNTNKKTEHYIPKWDELGNEVVEVDVRYFINQKVENDIPKFNLIYSDGECFIKSYTKIDYDEIIAKRKLEWKRQDKLNYKMMWERLDWFWIEVQNYKNNSGSPDKLLNTFKSLEFYDIEDCWNIINKMSCCKDIKNNLRNIINEKSKEKFNELLDAIKIKFDGKLEFNTVYCEPKNDLRLSFVFTDFYKFNSYYYSYDYITCENKSWIIPPSKVLYLFNKFKEDKEELIVKHCEAVDKIKNTLTWNKAPLLYDNYILGSYIDIGFNNICRHTKYIEDADEIIDSANKKIIDSVSDFYVSKYCMNTTDIRNYIDICLRDYKLIYNLLDSFINCDEYSFYYKGNKVISFTIKNDSMYFKDKIFNYNFVKKEIIKEFLKECVDIGVRELKNYITAIDIVADIKLYSNNVWEFNLDIENKAVIITLYYLIPYYDIYKKRVSDSKYVCISEMFNEDFYFTDYHKDVTDFLNTKIAPAMEELINEVIVNYNSSHINSALCRKSEINSYKGEI